MSPHDDSSSTGLVVTAATADRESIYLVHQSAWISCAAERSSSLTSGA